MSDDLPFGEPLYPQTAWATPKCKRHQWGQNVLPGDAPDLIRCRRCHHVQNPEKVRQGRNNRKRGGRDELAVARLLGGTKVGHFGGPEDVRQGSFVIQVKRFATARFPVWMTNELAKLPRADQRVPVLVIREAAGPGRRARAIAVVMLDDWKDLHGGTPE